MCIRDSACAVYCLKEIKNDQDRKKLETVFREYAEKNQYCGNSKYPSAEFYLDRKHFYSKLD